MNKYELISKLEKFAPLESQESWDCSGWIVETDRVDVSKVMLALTITNKTIDEAISKHCDMIISHHPLFFVPNTYRDIDIYSSHTPMDKAKGGTTEILIKELGFEHFEWINDFVRIVHNTMSVNELKDRLKIISPNLRIVNNNNLQVVNSIAFCAGAGSEFISTTDSDAFVTGDLKYHTAVEADKLIFDIGHFESEILILKVFKDILGIEVEISDEKSPFN